MEEYFPSDQHDIAGAQGSKLNIKNRQSGRTLGKHLSPKFSSPFVPFLRYSPLYWVP